MITVFSIIDACVLRLVATLVWNAEVFHVSTDVFEIKARPVCSDATVDDYVLLSTIATILHASIDSFRCFIAVLD